MPIKKWMQNYLIREQLIDEGNFLTKLVRACQLMLGAPEAEVFKLYVISLNPTNFDVFGVCLGLVLLALAHLLWPAKYEHRMVRVISLETRIVRSSRDGVQVTHCSSLARFPTLTWSFWTYSADDILAKSSHIQNERHVFACIFLAHSRCYWRHAKETRRL